MSLILPDEDIEAIHKHEWIEWPNFKDVLYETDGRLEFNRAVFKAIARAQARHMAREIVGYFDSMAAEQRELGHKAPPGEKNQYVRAAGEIGWMKTRLEAWLRQEGVLDAE